MCLPEPSVMLPLALRRRWPDLVAKTLEQKAPTVVMLPILDGAGLPDRADHPDRVMTRVAVPSDLFTNSPRSRPSKGGFQPWFPSSRWPCPKPSDSRYTPDLEGCWGWTSRLDRSIRAVGRGHRVISRAGGLAGACRQRVCRPVVGI
jgi:hypothetical protein